MFKVLKRASKGYLPFKVYREKWKDSTTDVHLHNIYHFNISKHYCGIVIYSTLEEGVNKISALLSQRLTMKSIQINN